MGPLSYLPSMAPIRAVLRALRRHPFASDVALAAGLAALVLSDVFTSRGTDGLGMGVRPRCRPDDGSAGLAASRPARRGRRRHGSVRRAVGDSRPDSNAGRGADPGARGDLLDRSARQAVGVLPRCRAEPGRRPRLARRRRLSPSGGAWLAGRLVQKRNLYAEALAERARVLEREQEANARLAAAEERVKLARETPRCRRPQRQRHGRAGGGRAPRTRRRASGDTRGSALRSSARAERPSPR